MRTLMAAAISIALCGSLLATERVPRLKETREDRGFATSVITLTDEYNIVAPPKLVDTEREKYVFTVYTQGEIDSQRADDLRRISALEDQLALLQKNVNRLSEINDVLTKQLEDLQKQAAKTQK